jgi:hypothetical protein
MRRLRKGDLLCVLVFTLGSCYPKCEDRKFIRRIWRKVSKFASNRRDVIARIEERANHDTGRVVSRAYYVESRVRAKADLSLDEIAGESRKTHLVNLSALARAVRLDLERKDRMAVSP